MEMGSSIAINKLCRKKQNQMKKLGKKIKQLSNEKQELHDEICFLRGVQAQISNESAAANNMVASLQADIDNLVGELKTAQRRKG